MEILKKKQESEDGNQDKYNVGDMQDNAQKQMRQQQAKMPKLAGMSAPKFPSMPNIKL